MRFPALLSVLFGAVMLTGAEPAQARQECFEQRVRTAFVNSRGCATDTKTFAGATLGRKIRRACRFPRRTTIRQMGIRYTVLSKRPSQKQGTVRSCDWTLRACAQCPSG